MILSTAKMAKELNPSKVKGKVLYPVQDLNTNIKTGYYKISDIYINHNNCLPRELLVFPY